MFLLFELNLFPHIEFSSKIFIIVGDISCPITHCTSFSFDMEEGIAYWLSRFLCADAAILGIGNELRGDDGFGSVLARRLCQKFAQTALARRIFDAEGAPENYLGKLAKMRITHLLILDAIVFGGAPGEVRIFDIYETAAPFALTHGPSNFQLMRMVLPDVEIKILAVQPREMRHGARISAEVQRAIDELIGILEGALKSHA